MSGTKFIVGAVGSILCIFAFCMYLYKSSLSSTPMPVVMHNESALKKEYFYDPGMGYRIRLPGGAQSAQHIPPPDESIDQVTAFACNPTVLGRAEYAIVIGKKTTGEGQFKSYVKANRNSLGNTGKGSKDTDLVSEGVATVNGYNAYVINVRGIVNGISAYGHEVFIEVGPSVYSVFGVAPVGTAENSMTDVVDSAISTFEVGDWGMAEGYEKPAKPDSAITGNIPNGGAGMRSGPAFTPPAPHHLTFSDVNEASKYVSSGFQDEANASLDYLIANDIPEASRHQVAAALASQLNSPHRGKALEALQKCANKENVPSIRAAFGALSNTNGRNVQDTHDALIAMQILTTLGDSAAVPLIQKDLQVSELRDEAIKSLAVFKISPEESLLPLLGNPRAGGAGDIIKLLGDVGTEKSILPLHHLLSNRNGTQNKAVQDAVTEIGKRLDLPEERYLDALLDQYVIDAPAGFTADTVSDLNTKQWTRTASGRAVKSVYLVKVSNVDTAPLIIPGNAPTMQAGSILFRQRSSTSPSRFQQAVVWLARDGAYQIELTATLDTSDSTAGTNMTAAAKKIHAAAQ